MSFNTLKDGNRIPVWFGISSVDGITPVEIKINSSTGRASIETGNSVCAIITNGVPKDAIKDDSRVSCIMGQSNADSTIYIPVSVNPATGAIMAKNT